MVRDPSQRVQVRHTAEEVGAGETVILTLADKGILDEDDADELENVLVVWDILCDTALHLCCPCPCNVARETACVLLMLCTQKSICDNGVTGTAWHQFAHSADNG